MTINRMDVNFGVDPHKLVKEFHETYNMPVGAEPHLLDVNRLALRLDLINEELDELTTSVYAEDIIEAVDALGDLVYVIYGMAIEMGVNLGPVMTEIQRSNMSKLGADGKPIYREDGKVLKGPGFFVPNIEDAMGL